MKSTRRVFLQHFAGFAAFQLISSSVECAEFDTKASRASRIGVLGHTGHGKTTLTSAITKVLAENGGARFVPYDRIKRPPERSINGVAVALANVEYKTNKRIYSHFDYWRNTDAVQAIKTRATPLDAAILVVSVAEGPKPQTRDHVKLAQDMGIPKLIVYLNKVDDVQDPELVDLVQFEAGEILGKWGYSEKDGHIFVRGSALMALQGKKPQQGRESIAKLLDAMDTAIV